MLWEILKREVFSTFIPYIKRSFIHRKTIVTALQINKKTSTFYIQQKYTKKGTNI